MKAVNRASRRGLDTTNNSAAPAAPAAQTASEVGHRHTGDPGHREHDGAEHDGRAEVTLSQAQARSEPATSEIGTIARAGVDDVVTVAGRADRRPARHRELEEFRRLQAERRRRRTHELAPFTLAPMPGANGAAMATTRAARAESRTGASDGRGPWRRSRGRSSPMAAHIACLAKTRYGECPRLASVTADADSTITRPSITSTAPRRRWRSRYRSADRALRGRTLDAPRAVPSRARASAGSCAR